MRPEDPAVAARVVVPPPPTPTLFVVVDTEEEFDWSAPFSRARTSVSAMRHIGRAQAIFDRFGIVPTYVVDFPVASQPEGVAPLQAFAADRRATVGAHLHPWVTPPFEEELGRSNSFACNLPAALERAKLTALSDTIGEAFGARPTVYKAGRYGLGARTLPMLAALGIDIDTSVNPHMDYSAEGGPDFRAFDARPRWIGRDRLLEIPCTTGFAGLAGRTPGARLHALAVSSPWAQLRAPGVLARAGLLNRIMLSPEGSRLEEMVLLTKALLRQGVRTFTLSFHSPSVAPGHTPYVRTAADLEGFLRALERYFEFFFAELGGVASTPRAFRGALEAPAEPH